MPDWKSPETLERLIGAIIASITASGGTVNNNAIASYMDETFDAVENRTRKYKKDAQKLIKEAADAGRQGQDMRKRIKHNTPNTTPRKPRKTASATDLHGVSTGRVQKTPTKRASPLKNETISNTSSDFGDYTAAATGNSFALAEMGFGGQNHGALYGFDAMEDDFA